MKKLFLFFLLCISFNCFSQITLDFQSSTYLFRFKLNDTETKFLNDDYYFIDSTKQLVIYNLDGSLYKTIQMPQIQNSHILGVPCITTTLFDTDPSNIEYLVFYTINGVFSAKVIREDGTILLDEADACYSSWDFDTWPMRVFSTEEGTKLQLDYSNNNGSSFYQSKVFNLPGHIPNGIQDDMQLINKNLLIYPNPNNGNFSVKLYKNDNDKQVIDLYSPNGKLVNSYLLSGNVNEINNSGLSEGIYFLNARSREINSSTKIIIKK